MSRLIITRGLPACGKTTRAREWVAEDPVHRARVNRDDLRSMAHDGVWLGQDTERQIKSARDALIGSLLAKGIDVVCDDTNLPQRTARDLAQLAALAKVDLEVWDMTDVPLEECLRRNRHRTDKDPLEDDAIRDMHARYVAAHKGRPLPLPEESVVGADAVTPYVPRSGAPKAILVDIDGTLALHGARSPFDETRVREDRPNEPVVAVVRALALQHELVFCSGRTEGCRDATQKWLALNVGIILTAKAKLFMRPIGDTRKDAIVKREIFDREIRDSYNVVAVLDDRNQVVAMWRELGLTVLQVADGDF